MYILLPPSSHINYFNESILLNFSHSSSCSIKWIRSDRLWAPLTFTPINNDIWIKVHYYRKLYQQSPHKSIISQLITIYYYWPSDGARCCSNVSMCRAFVGPSVEGHISVAQLILLTALKLDTISLCALSQ